MDNGFSIPLLERFCVQQLQANSPAELTEIADRAEELYFEIDDDGSYSATNVSRYLLGETGSDVAGTSVSGQAVRGDLRHLVDELTRASPQAVEDGDEPVLLAEDLARQFNVSIKTISRWRREGLIGRHVLVDGRPHVGYFASSVERFARNHANRISRAARFRQLSDDERRGIVDQYRRLRREGTSRSDAVRLVASDARCSRETVRNLLKRRRAEQIANLSLEYIHSDEFEDPQAEATILSPTPQPTRTPKKTRPPADLSPYLASLYETPLLTADQERHLFRKYNYLKYKASQLRSELDVTRPAASLIESIELAYDEAVELKNQLIQANLRLVVSLAKQRVNPSRDFYSLVSDGNISLIRAVEKFDYSRGFKFSTYATWAVIKNFARTIPSEAKQQARFQPSGEELFSTVEDDRGDQVAEERDHARRQREVNRLMSYLNDREQDIIARRFGLDYQVEPQTLQEVGDELGVSKERIRQLQSRAIEKLRHVAETAKIDLTALN